MGFFSFGKNKNKQTDCCNGACKSCPSAQSEQPTGGAAVKVLGSGCAKCNELEANTKAALTELGIDASIEHVKDFAQIAAYGVMSTPALVVNNKVLVYGKVATTTELVKLLEKEHI